MNRRRTGVVGSLLLLAIGCGGASAAGERGPAGRPETPADMLARRVAEAAGAERWGEVAELRFRFVVTADGARRADVAHRWDVRGQRDRVSWTEEGHTYDVVVDLLTRTG